MLSGLPLGQNRSSADAGSHLVVSYSPSREIGGTVGGIQLSRFCLLTDRVSQCLTLILLKPCQCLVFIKTGMVVRVASRKQIFLPVLCRHRDTFISMLTA